MDLSFIKKEEPVDYALILSNEDENSQSEYVISNYDADHANSMVSSFSVSYFRKIIFL